MRVLYRSVATALSVLVVFFCVGEKTAQAAGPTVITANITMPTTWVKENSPYIVSNSIVVNAMLTIEPGTIVKFNNNATNNTPAGFVIKNDFSAVGTAEEKIVFTSICDDRYGGDTTSYSSRCHNGPINSEWSGISLNDTSAHATIEHTLIFRANRGISYQTTIQSSPYRSVSVKHTEIRQSGSAIYLRNTMPILSFNILEGNTYGLEVITGLSERIPVIRDSSFLGNGIAVKVSYPGTVDVDARFNWWGDATGPYFQSPDPALDNSGGLGDRVVESRVKFRPWLRDVPDDSSVCAECASNVLFLPGIKGSKLYKDDGTTDGDTLWLPTILSNDLEELGMDESGQSLNMVHTKDVLATIPFGSLYESFLQKIANLKSNGTINDHQSFAYDWRNSVDDIVSNGTLYPAGVIRSLVTDAEVLARSSKTRKISIIAHSNGGLLAKALMIELEKRGLESEVETVIFVGTPQMGTPLAILSLLYGYDEPVPALVSQSRARTLAENMPGAYGLLPSEEYYNRMTDPFITFSSEHTRYKKFREVYGIDIGDFWEGSIFLHADDDGRSKPPADDIDVENVLNGTLMDQAKYTHEQLDSWTPPIGIGVVQIAGWGLDTVSGVDYTEKSLAKCYYSGTSVPSCINEGQYEPVYNPQLTVDGDRVVVTPSALMMSEENDIKKYWIDLYKNNKSLSVNQQHRNLLEIDCVQTLLSNILTRNESTPLPAYIHTTRPDNYASAKPRLRMALYSPLDIHLYDTHGNHTGPKKMIVDGQEVTVLEESIPNSYYYQFGERKYVGWSEDDDVRVEMDGYDLGAYTIKLSEVKATATDEEETTHATFENLPTTADTMVQFTIPSTGLDTMSPVVADVTTEDGVKRYSVDPVINGVAIYEEASDTIAPVSTVMVSGASGANSWYISDVSVTLTATDEEGGSGVAKTEYSLDGTTWREYTGSLSVTTEGVTVLQYFSIDTAGNKEEVKTETLKIDRVAPEGKVTFNTTTQKLDILGVDDRGGAVTVAITELPVVFVGPRLKNHDRSHEEHRGKKRFQAQLTDEAGHVTSIVFSRDKQERNELALRLQSVSYDTAQTRIMGTEVQYEWQMNRFKKYQKFEAELKTVTHRLESRYMPKKNETWVRERTNDDDDEENGHDSEWQKLPGLVVPYLMTTQGKIEVKY